MANGSHKMKRLGHLSLDPNERTGFQARELKSIQINAPATSLRLLLHSCYPNKLNIYNQVGIVALIVTGEPLSQEQIMKLAYTTPSESPRNTCNKPRGVDLTSVDSITAQRIQKLQQEKETAVQEEEYDEAKRLKILIGRLRTLGEQIKGLECRKKMAVDEEDYDQAKLCKLEIEKLRQVDVAAPEPNEDQTIMPERETRRAPQMTHMKVGTVPMETLEQGIQTQQMASPSPSNPTPSNPSPSNPSPSNPSPSEDRFDTEPNVSSLDYEGSELSSSVGHIQSASPLSDDGSDYVNATSNDYANTTNSAVAPVAETQNSGGDEALTPEPMPESLLKQHTDMLSVLDQYHLQCLFSKHWQLRDKAVQYVSKGIKSSGYYSDAAGSFRCVYKVLARGLNDRVSHVFFGSIQTIRPFVLRFAPEIPSRELHSCVGEVMLILLEKMGDTNPRTREACADSIMFLALAREVGLPVIAPFMLKIPKNMSAWRPILGRLQWLLVAVPKFGLQPRPRLGAGFAAETLMHFAVHCFNYSNGEVRNAAMKLTLEIYKFIGLTVEKYLKGVKPIIREAVVALFEKSGEEETPAFASSSQPKGSTFKSSSITESIKQVKNFRLSDSPRRGKAHVVDAQVRSVDRFETGRAWENMGDFSMNKPSVSGRPSCSATRR